MLADPEQGAIYSQYTDAFVKSGKMSLELSAQLDREGGVEKLATDIANASPEERARLGTDKAYRDNVLSAMSNQAKRIALAVAEKERVRPGRSHSHQAHRLGQRKRCPANATMAMKPEELARAGEELRALLSRRFQNRRSE